MLSLLLLIRRILSLIFINKRLWDEDKEFNALVVIFLAILISGTAFFTLVEKWSIIDSMYFCVMTIATIGYGDFAPTTTLSKLFTIGMALSGIGIFVLIVTKLAQALTRKEIEKSHRHLENKVEKR